jgi:CheY-like chemotaxis protein/HPt (histidine-containing phosphotransfer) domain-containing protein
LDKVDFALRSAVDSAVRLFAGKAESKQIELSYAVAPGLPDTVVGDSNRLCQVLINLVGNAIKFTDAGEIHVSADLAAETDTAVEVRFTVRDTGPGIPEEQRELIFESFAQGDASARRRHGGTGLGLAISRRLVSLMGGRIWVESEVGRWSAFHFTVRLGLPRDATAPVVHAPVGPRDMRVLVADDSATARAVVSNSLRAWGCTVAEASNAAQAMDELRRAVESRMPFAVAVLDAHMPGIDGYRLARLIRAEPRFAATRLILLSGVEAPPQERMTECGIQAAVPKPVRASELYDALATVTNGARETPPEDGSAAPGVPEPGARILLAEDNEINQEVTREMLALLGYACTCLASGQEAVEAVVRDEYDLVLMDCQMPGMDGYQATGAIRAWEQQSRPGVRIPIVALTAHAMTGDRERCLAAGMDDYLTKPLQDGELSAMLRKWLHRAAPAPAPAAPSPPPAADAVAAAPDERALEAAVIERCSGQRALARRLLNVFVQQLHADLDAISAAVEASDSAQLARAAHRLKGVSGNLALGACQEAAAALEQLARAGRTDGVEPHVARLRAQAERIARLRLVGEAA